MSRRYAGLARASRPARRRSAGLQPASLSCQTGSRHAARIDLSKPVLFQPSTQIRYRRAGGGRGGDAPQYPPVALAIDYILPDGFAGPASLEITDSTGRVVRAVQAAAGGGRGQGGEGGADDPDMRGGGERGRAGAAPMTLKAGHNRYLWDYRWNGGPLAAPGKYTARLIIGTGGPSSDPALTKSFEVRVDPDVLKDGITVADLVEQQNFLLQVRDTVAEASLLRTHVQQAMKKANVQPPPSPGPGEWVSAMKYAHPLQGLWARLVTAPGIYEQGMLIDQLNNIVSVEGGADQKVGNESRKRFEDLKKEMKAIKGELKKVAGR